MNNSNWQERLAEEFMETQCNCVLEDHKKDEYCPSRTGYYDFSLDTVKAFINSLLEEERQGWIAEEGRFLSNVLDGIDLADEAMGNIGGGTKAIRLALQSRGLLTKKE